jgi:hypothetical protein
MIDPILKEVYPIIQVFGPGGEWLHRQETFLIPDFGHLIIK